MIKAEYRLALKTPPDAVFDYVTDKLDAGPLRVGNRFRLERLTRGHAVTLNATVTALERGRRFDFHSVDNDGFVGDFTTVLEPSNGGTELHWAVEMQPHRLLYRLLQPFIQRDLRSAVENDFRVLREKLDGPMSASA